MLAFRLKASLSSAAKTGIRAFSSFTDPELDYYQILNIDKTATPEQIK